MVRENEGKGIMRFVILSAVLLLSAPLHAQSDSLLYQIGPIGIVEMDDQGQVTRTIVATPSGFTSWQLLNSPDNRSYWTVCKVVPTLDTGLIRFDDQGTMTTIVSGPPLQNVPVMVHDQDGDSLILNEPTHLTWEILRLRGTSLTRLCTLPSGTVDVSGVCIDPETGLLVVSGVRGSGVVHNGYYRIDPATGATTTLASHPASDSVKVNGARRLAYDAARGAYVDINIEEQIGATSLVFARPGSGIVPAAPLGKLYKGWDMVTAGGRAHPVRYYVIGYEINPWKSTLVHVDGNGRVLRVVPTVSPPWASATPLLRKHSNHLQWFLYQAPNDRGLRLSFPGEPGRPFVVGLSLTGMRPGVPLPDGRTIPLAVDALTVLGLAGGVPGLITNTVGVLSARGEATVRLNLSALGPAARGVKIWAAAMVLDPGASSGIAHLVGPKIVVLR